jgi:hypothetical protein
MAGGDFGRDTRDHVALPKCRPTGLNLPCENQV